jgi:hypothetical protein
MNQTRTGGMLTIGILNIVFGSIRCVGALLMVLVGGGLAAFSSAAPPEMADSGQVASFGGAVVMLGLFGFAIGAMLLIGGIGVLKVAPWGRGFSLAAGTLAIVNTLGQAVILSAFGLGTFVGLVYPVILIACLMRPDWKAAFAGECAFEPGVIDEVETGDDQFKAAA